MSSRRSSVNRRSKERYGSRRTRVREPLPFIVVVCDDRKTAPTYLTALKSKLKTSVALSIVTSHAGKGAEELLKRARQAGDDDTESVWLLLDLEREPHLRQAAERVKSKAAGTGVRVALSNPCFEVWTLLHLVDTGEAFPDC